MPYVIPTFNITCNLWTNRIQSVPPRVAAAPCNLAWGKRVNVASTGGTTEVGVPLLTMTLLLPATVDIRGFKSATSSDLCEVPAGSGRYYIVWWADYIGYGFPNAHKGAVLEASSPFKTPDT